MLSVSILIVLSFEHDVILPNKAQSQVICKCEHSPGEHYIV